MGIDSRYEPAGERVVGETKAAFWPPSSKEFLRPEGFPEQDAPTSKCYEPSDHVSEAQGFALLHP